MTPNFSLIMTPTVFVAYTIYLAGLLALIIVYAYLRPRPYALVTDVFFLLVVVLWGPITLVCMLFKFPSTMQPAFGIITEPGVVAEALYVLLAGFVSVTAGFGLAEYTTPVKMKPIAAKPTPGHHGLGIVALLYCAGLAATVLSSADGRAFLSQSLDFASDFSNETYNFIRREAFSESVLISDVLARTRYSVNALMVTISAIYLMRWCSTIFAFVAISLLVPIIVCSVSKAPYVYYATYIMFAGMLTRHAADRLDSRMLRRFGVLCGLGVGALLLLYFIQYGQGVAEGSFSGTTAISVAFYRIFEAGSDGLRLHVAAFPDYLDFGFGAGIGLLAPLLGQDARDYAAEVVALDSIALLGRTTYQTLFVGQAYGDFGYAGVVLYGFVLGIFLSTLQRLVTWLSIREIRIACTATLLPNLSFLLTLPATSSLLSYGVASIPIAAFGLERLVKIFTSGRAVRQPVRVGT